ncbi:cytochrome C [Piscinibacter sp.]|jgi:hypothetical protein|uniref:cytochrome C n=1 Tax=Piscinibacter sp. TaxID=1903157 RepID=UPI003559FEC7
MNILRSGLTIGLSKSLSTIAALAVVGIALLPEPASAIPLFNRQTGQNCVACHAGGQFPELTPYGRLFKMTGYTIGERTTPVSAMAVLSYSKVADTSKSDDPSADFQKNGSVIFPTASLFLGGKVSDNVGAFAQITYDRYATQSDDGKFHGHSNADNIDLRYADRFIDARRDLIFGISANNNPSISDPWNTAAAWMQYVPVPSPTSSQFIDGNAPYPGFGAGGNVAGITAYAYWNRMVYAELGGYRTANGLFRFMSAGLGDADVTKLKGINPYWRLAVNHEWGAHSLMIGTSGMVARVYDDPLDTSDPSTTHRFRDLGVDAQYQYILDPHVVTAQFAYARSHHRYPDFLAGQSVVAFVDQLGNPLADTNAEDTTNVTRAKLTYVYQAKYGGSLGFFNLTGSTNTANQSSGYAPGTPPTITVDPAVSRVNANFSGDPATRGWTYEAFWTPIQYVRIGAQYTAYSRYNGASSNYDGLGRNARDNNSLFLYVWGAY